MEKTLTVTILLIIVTSLIGLVFFLFKRFINNTLINVKEQLSYVKTEWDLMFKAVGEKTDRLSKNMADLSSTIEKNHEKQIENQTDIASIKSEVKSQGKHIERLEDKVDKHISGHNKD